LSPAELAVLVLAGSPPMLADSVLNKLGAYLEQGGSALVMASGMQLAPQQPFASPSPVAWNRVLEPYGVSIRGDMAYDLAANERVAVPASFGRVLVSYPFWLRAVSTRAASMNQDLETLFVPWGSTVDTAGAVAGTIVPLFTTTDAGGVESGQAFIAPQRQDFPQDSLASRLLAVLVNPLAAEAGAVADSARGLMPRGRLVVVGSGDLASDRWIANAPQNAVFALNAVDWLAQDEALVAIRSKNRAPPGLSFSSPTKRDFVKYANLIGIPLLIIGAGIARLWRRRQMTRRTYTPLLGEGA
jgi:ABC-type uncharacterized transport system involved in gliding motility auxiliary subunit